MINMNVFNNVTLVCIAYARENKNQNSVGKLRGSTIRLRGRTSFLYNKNKDKGQRDV